MEITEPTVLDFLSGRSDVVYAKGQIIIDQRRMSFDTERDFERFIDRTLLRTSARVMRNPECTNFTGYFRHSHIESLMTTSTHAPVRAMWFTFVNQESGLLGCFSSGGKTEGPFPIHGGEISLPIEKVLTFNEAMESYPQANKGFVGVRKYCEKLMGKPDELYQRYSHPPPGGQLREYTSGIFNRPYLPHHRVDRESKIRPRISGPDYPVGRTFRGIFGDDGTPDPFE